tara:strand:+ start:589 stop:954 length:366 start_codon:yes stop_codon:yes gene_type:complete
MNDKLINNNQLKKDSKQELIINFYGLMAVLFVLIPEWIAEIGIFVENNHFKNEIPKIKSENVGLQLLCFYNMSLKELRKISSELKLIGYAGENKKTLIKRIYRKMKQKEAIKTFRESLKWW